MNRESAGSSGPVMHFDQIPTEIRELASERDFEQCYYCGSVWIPPWRYLGRFPVAGPRDPSKFVPDGEPWWAEEENKD